MVLQRSAIGVERIFSGGHDTISLCLASLGADSETIWTSMLLKHRLHLACTAIDKLLLLLWTQCPYIIFLYFTGTNVHCSIRTCWRGPFLAYTSPALASEMMFEQSLKLVSDFSSDFNTALHGVILKYCKYF